MAYQRLVGESPGPVSAGAAAEPGCNTAAVSVSLLGFYPLLLSRSALLTAGTGEGGFYRLVSLARFLDAVKRKCLFAQWRYRPQVLHNLPRGLGEGWVANC